MSKLSPNLKVFAIIVLVAVVGLIVMNLTGPAVGNIFSSVNRGLASGESAGTGLYGGDQGGFYAPGSTAPLVDGIVANEPYGPVDEDVSLVTTETETRFTTDGRIILKNAWLNITVANPQSRLSEITALAEEMGGWVVTSSTSRYTNSVGEQVARGSITIRVPQNRLNEALDRIKTGAELINSESQSGEDVTTRYVDLSSRLKNLEAAETQLQAILDDARRVEDVLSVYNELVTVRGEIESIKGQLKYYDEAAAYSSIAIELLPPEPGPVQSQTTGWNPANAAESALGALLSVVRFLVDLVISLVVFLGPIIVVLGIVWMLYRLTRRTTRQQPNL